MGTLYYFIHKFSLYKDKIKEELAKKTDVKEEYAFAEPIIYFSERMSKAFHGKRGLVTYTRSRDIKRCINNLLSQPLKLKKIDGNGSFPLFWWFRGSSAMYIDKYRWLGNRHLLINELELNVRKVVAYVDPSGRYYGQYVYIETDADRPTGLYRENTEEEIQSCEKELGYYYEEYGVFKLFRFINKSVTLTEFDDGHTTWGGKLMSPSREDCEHRTRFLTPYNLIISSQESSFNCPQFDGSDDFFNKLLRKEITIEEFNDYMKKFPKPMDRFY